VAAKVTRAARKAFGFERRARTVEDSRMTLIEHLKELRNRLFIALLAIIIVTVVVGVWFYNPIFNFLRHPYCELPPTRREGGASCVLIFTHPTDAFFVRMRVALLAGALFSSPIWLYQLWAFITPGLHRHERRWTLSFIVSGVLLFVTGAALAYLVMHTALDFLLGAGGNGVKPLLGVSEYLSFVTRLLVIFGASFLFPLIVILLNLAGVLSAKRMASWRRGEIFLCFLFAGFATPGSDPFTMPALALCLCLLYEVAILVAKWNDKRRAARDEMAEFRNLADDEASPAPTLGAIEPPRRVAEPTPIDEPDFYDPPARASVGASPWDEDDIT
jgi:sec-independent protein translocase protein TatC